MSTHAERITCFYCGELVLKSRIEHDHFPVPQSAGGTSTVPACILCHDLKDRTDWSDLTLEMKAAFLEDFAGMSRAGKIVVAQLMREVYETRATLTSKGGGAAYE